MRKHRIIIHRFALSDLDDAYQFAARHAPTAATAWLTRFEAALRTLETNPDRCPTAHESRRTGRDLREFLFGRRPNIFRVIFLIEDDSVRVLRIRRSARRYLSNREIEESLEDEA